MNDAPNKRGLPKGRTNNPAGAKIKAEADKVRTVTITVTPQHFAQLKASGSPSKTVRAALDAWFVAQATNAVGSGDK